MTEKGTVVRGLLFAMVLAAIYATVPSTSVLSQESPSIEHNPDIAFAMVPVGDHPDGYFDDIEMKPGESKVLEVDLVNLSPIDVPFDVFHTNAHNGSNGGFVSGDADETLAAPATWIDFESRSLTLAPEQVERVSFMISVPKDVSPGQYISALVMIMQDKMETPGTDLLTHRLSHAISVSVLIPGEIQVSFEVGQPEFLVESHSVVVPITNTGNYLVRPEGLLVFKDLNGKEILRTDIQMGSVYAGNTAPLGIGMPTQMNVDGISVSLDLTDPVSGFAAAIENEPLYVPEEVVMSPLTLERAEVSANDSNIQFANVDVTVANASSQIPATNVNLVVFLDGKEVDSYPLATNQVLLNGDNTYAVRYIPPTAWRSGAYTFRIEIFSVDPAGGSQIELLVEDLDTKILVP